MSIAYVPNTAKNRRKIDRYFPKSLPPSADFKATNQRGTTFLDEEIRSYFWKGYTDCFHVQTWYYDVLQRFVKEAGFSGVTYSNCSRAYKFRAPEPSKRKNSRKKERGIFRRILG